MDAILNPVNIRANVEMLLEVCDICSEVPATDPVGTLCGHNFCRSCLNEAFQILQGELQGARPCPVCETVNNVPIHVHAGSEGSSPTRSADPTSGITTVEAASESNADVVIPIVATPNPPPAAGMGRNAVRMQVVRDFLNEMTDHTHQLQLDLSRRLCEVRARRIRELEQTAENLVQMNSALLHQVETRAEEMGRMSRRIEQLENQTVRAGHAFDGMLRSRRFGGLRIITPTPIAGMNDEESVEGRLFTTNDVTRNLRAGM